MKSRGNIFKATNAKSLEHLTAGQWVKKTQMEKSQSVYALVWSPVFSCIFSSLKVYPSQCSALRMHTCGATMIHIITTFGDDSNQKPEVHPANNLNRPDSQRRDLHKAQLWETKARVCCVAYSSGKKCLPIYGCPLGQNIQEWKTQSLRETHSKSTNTLNITIQTKQMCNKRGNVGEGSDGPYFSNTGGVALSMGMSVWVCLLHYLSSVIP